MKLVFTSNDHLLVGGTLTGIACVSPPTLTFSRVRGLQVPALSVVPQLCLSTLLCFVRREGSCKCVYLLFDAAEQTVRNLCLIGRALFIFK